MSSIQNITQTDKLKKKSRKKNLFSSTLGESGLEDSSRVSLKISDEKLNNPTLKESLTQQEITEVPIEELQLTSAEKKQEEQTQQIEAVKEEELQQKDIPEESEEVIEELAETQEELEEPQEESAEPEKEVEELQEESTEPEKELEELQEESTEPEKESINTKIKRNPPIFKVESTKLSDESRYRQKSTGIYTTNIITRRINLKINYVGQNLKQNLEEKIKSEIEGKCIIEGYIKPDSCKIITFSSGIIKSDYVQFEVVIECLICNPVEGIIINCIAENITKAGIRATLDEENSPLVIFIARDHFHLSDYFNTITEKMEIKVRVIGQRYELNDKYISVIGELVEHSTSSKKKKVSKPRLVIE
jgi:DNA-directed RNA polymerase subunit E'/Rpb7